MNDEKEIAEHLMLLDLGRNDVGKVAKIGTVNVTEKMIIEYYSHVMHIVSNVEGKLDLKFDALYYFEKSAETYLTALATGKELNVASHEVAEKTAQEWSNYPSDMGRAHLDQIRLILDKEEPDYQN